MNYYIGCPMGYPHEVNIVRKLIPPGSFVITMISRDSIQGHEVETILNVFINGRIKSIL